MPDMDMRRMQEEAARRAREMQSRARHPRQASPPHGGSPPTSQQPRPPEPSPPPSPPPAAAPSGSPSVGQQPALPASLLDELFKDQERTVLLALLLMLGGEDGNNELMFALMFLLM